LVATVEPCSSTLTSLTLPPAAASTLRTPSSNPALESFGSGKNWGLILLALFGAWFLTGRALIPIQAAFNRQQEFVADAAHELRTPLNAILGFSEVLENGIAGPLQSRQVEYVGLIRQSSRHLLHVINAILDLARTICQPEAIAPTTSRAGLNPEGLRTVVGRLGRLRRPSGSS